MSSTTWSRLLLLAAASLLIWPAVAAAHTELSTSAPEDGEILLDPPIEVILTFTAALQPDSEAEVSVIDDAGDDLVAAPPLIDGLTVTVPLNLAVTPGPHIVEWTVVAVDGDEVSGSFGFSYAPEPVPTPEEDATAPAVVVPLPTETPPPTPETSESSESELAVVEPTAQPTATEAAGDDDSDSSLISAFGIGVGLLLIAIGGMAVGLKVARGRDADG